ncbi:cytochrome ubiquinol oxidase subunit I [Mesorhizobium sp. M1076]|uniref:cytochrome ubiquinol oxidase subunit I n=1 Tax=Mesorhizobium sp. M1076 TaxID=2957054 RepID=UPI003335E18F
MAVIAGWITTEVGRQPWTVYGLLRTADSVTPSLTSFDVVLSLIGYIAVYLIDYPAGLFLMLRLPVATAAVAFFTWRVLGSASETKPFVGAIGLFVLSFVGIVISLFPMIVPHHLRFGNRPLQNAPRLSCSSALLCCCQ